MRRGERSTETRTASAIASPFAARTRAGRNTWSAVTQRAYPPRNDVSSTAPLRPPSNHARARATTPAGKGISKARRNFSALARPHGRAGPIPIINSKPRKTGTAIRLKYGSPTLTFTPRTASAMIGNSVPISTVNVTATSSRLFSRKAPSRAMIESSPGSETRLSMRSASSATEASSAIPRNTRNSGPIGLWVNECTELTTPDRVRNVPRIVSRKVTRTRITVQALSVPRRCWTIAEWSAAMAVSHGRNEAFSTGSQAQ